MMHRRHPPPITVLPTHRDSCHSEESGSSSNASHTLVSKTVNANGVPTNNNGKTTQMTDSTSDGGESLNESGYASQCNIAELLTSGASDEDIVAVWLSDIGYGEYIALFTAAGYDLTTMSRMTPEDLTALGISRVQHRRRLTNELHRLQLNDRWPCSVPQGNKAFREWLLCLRLAEYTRMFEAQGYTSCRQAMQMSGEDFDDVGIVKLGHIKRLQLAIRKLKDYRNNPHGTRAASVGAHTPVMGERMAINVSSQAPLPPPRAGSTHSNTSSNAPMSSNGQINMMSTFNQMTHSAHQQHAGTSLSRQMSGGNVGTFPRRSSNTAHITTDAVIHAAPPPKPAQRPTLPVKPRPKVALPVPPMRRCSGNDDDACCAGTELQSTMPHIPSLIKLQLHSPSRLLLGNNEASTTDPVEDGEADTSFDDSILPPPPDDLVCERSLHTLRQVSDASAHRSMPNTPRHMSVAPDTATMQRRSTQAGNRSSSVTRHSGVSNGATDRWTDIESMFQNFNETLDSLMYEPNRTTQQDTAV